MAKKDNEGNWINPRGRKIHESLIKKEDKIRERMLVSAFKKMERLDTQMRKYKGEIIKSIDIYMQRLAKEKRVAYRNGKGNLTLTGFSGDIQLEIKMNDIIEFDENLQLAKQCIDQWIADKLSKTKDAELVAVVGEAFNLDKRGKVNTQSLLRLKELKIKGELWSTAMELLDGAIRIAGTRRYLMARRRNNPEDKWDAVNLNFSSI